MYSRKRACSTQLFLQALSTCRSGRLLEPLASLIPSRNPGPHAYIPITGITPQYHTTAPTLALLLSLLLLVAASQRGTFLALPASSLYHTMPAARDIDVILPTTATPAATLAALGRVQRHKRSFGGFRLSPTASTRLDEGSSRAKHALLGENARSTELPTDCRLQYSSTPSHQPPLNYKIDSTNDKKDQKNPVEKNSSQSDCVRNGLRKKKNENEKSNWKERGKQDGTTKKMKSNARQTGSN